MISELQNQQLKQLVIEASSNPAFKHHSWFVDYHLNIVETIATELCNKHPEANKLYTLLIVWLHDYEKIINLDNQYNTELIATRNLMKEVGYDADVIEKLVNDLNQYNAKENLDTASIELQIASSSDAASHLVGPFKVLYWYENPSLSIQELQTENKRKVTVDWEKKITLPEVREAFESRYQDVLEITGEIPRSFF